MSKCEGNDATECKSNADECHGTKRHAEDEVEKVHSANAWEKVDLGDDGRKNKFLRLMGASKKDHQGRIVIGEKKPTAHTRSSEETQKLNSELENQYQQGLELKISGCARRHTGLGFADAADNWKAPDDGNTGFPDMSRTASEVSIASRDTDTFLPVPETGDVVEKVNDGKGKADSVGEGIAADVERETAAKSSGSSSETKKPAIGGFVRSSDSS